MAQTNASMKKKKKSAARSMNGNHRNGSAKKGSSLKKSSATKKPAAKTSAAAKKTAAARRSSAPKKNKSRGKAKPSRKVVPSGKDLQPETLLSAYREMLRSRLLDEKTITLYKQNKCHFQIGAAGHEAVQVAAAHTFQVGTDWFYPYYRDMALCVALGMTNEEIMLNAMNKEADPNSHGRQMPMHYGHKDLRIVNQSSPTGTQFLQAVGCAMASKLQNKQEVTYVSAGEGTCSQGDFHEALNWAAREKLPVVFLIENNEYAISVHVSEQLSGDVYDIVQGYKNLERYTVDGTDYIASHKVLEKAHARAMAGKGPSVIEAHVPRLQSHSISDNHLKYRTKEDIEKEKERCPIAQMRSYILKKKLATKEDLDTLQKDIKKDVDESAEVAEKQPDCDPASALDFNYVNDDPASSIEEGTASGEEIHMVDALNHALSEELERDKNVYVFGQDVAHGKGGVFTVTAGLTKKYGKKRVFNAPLAESSIIGVSVGLATRGLKPVAEIQFGDYIWTGMMQIRNELAMMHYRSGGDFSCPAVIRVPVGGYIHGACYHSQNIEATFAHFPGLYIAYPSNATDAKGLLKSSIRGEDPVLFLEHKGLYRQVHAKGPEGDSECLVPLGKAKIVREGSDLTIITWGALVSKSLAAAKQLEKEGFSIEIIDIRSIVPLDIECIFESVRKTGRALVAHEDVQFMGFGAEIAAKVSDACFMHLDAPVKRVGMKSAAAVPHSSFLEAVILPQNSDVLKAAKELLEF